MHITLEKEIISDTIILNDIYLTQQKYQCDGNTPSERSDAQCDDSNGNTPSDPSDHETDDENFDEGKFS